MQKLKKRCSILLTGILSCVFLMGVASCETIPEIHPLGLDVARDRFMVQELVRYDGLVFQNKGWVYGLDKDALVGAMCIDAFEYSELMKYLRREQKKTRK